MKRKVLLIEPDYKNKYPPMGLMKLATYFRRCKDDVRFYKGDLKRFAAELLCEEYFNEIGKPFELASYYNDLVDFIKSGKYVYLDNIPEFRGTSRENMIKEYRKRFVEKKVPRFDIVGVTTLFTFYWKKTVDTINEAKVFLKPKKGRMLVGGIAASILPNEFYEATGVHPHEGLLDKPGAIDEGNEDVIDELPLDYSILEEIDYKYPASDAYFGYMTRGCPRNCPFCAVKTLEPKYKNYISIKEQLKIVDEKFGAKRDLLLMDNNVFASNCFNQIIDEIIECGFEKGAKYKTPNEYDIAYKNIIAKYNLRAYIKKMVSLYDKITDRLPENEQGEFYQQREELGLIFPQTAELEAIKALDETARAYYEKCFKSGERERHIDFNQGLDARLATDEKMEKLSHINIRPLRIAFDHYDQKEVYINAIKMAAKHGIKHLSNYLLYNFEDTPDELYYRMRINVELCEELDVTIYSFPMKYHPISDPDFFDNRDYIGKNWNRKFIRAIQAILNSTKGKIGRGVTFFEEAFGRDIEEFRQLLWMPETFIIYRRRYNAELRERLLDKYPTASDEDCDYANEWASKFQALSPLKREKAQRIIAENKFDGKYDTTDKAVLDILRYYEIKRP